MMLMGGAWPIGSEIQKQASAMSPSLLRNLQDQKTQLEDKLARVNAALDALEKNPGVAEALELVSRAVL